MAIPLLSSFYLLPVVQSRVDTGIDDFNNYLQSVDHNDTSRETPIGIRLELWRSGWNMFLEYPILGVGVGGFKPAMQSRADRYQVLDKVVKFKYVHNQYIAALATRGIPGLILLLLVMLMPIYIAMRHKSSEQESFIAQISIILICLTYAIGMSIRRSF